MILALQGQQVFSWIIHTHMARHVRYTISFFFIQKFACGMKWVGEGEGLVVVVGGGGVGGDDAGDGGVGGTKKSLNS